MGERLDEAAANGRLLMCRDVERQTAVVGVLERIAAALERLAPRTWRDALNEAAAGFRMESPFGEAPEP